ncbi:hypothetical protein LABOLPEG_00045 [Pseudomonas phage phi 21A]|nr:hypothetical protein LABOLPEG_00045 [Pseudomonas phage phi 21A]
MSKPARKAPAIKFKGRKYVVVNTTVARKDHRNVVVQLVKRAGKVQWFVKEGDVLTRYGDFWTALKAYSERQDELGVPGQNGDVSAIIAGEFPVGDVDLPEGSDNA